MKSSKLNLIKLAKTAINEHKNWGENEIFADKEISKPDMGKLKEQKRVQSAGELLEIFRKKICDCKKCSLGKTRLNFVFGVGNPNAEIMFVGEGPGFKEDHKGEPFIGRAGALLDKIIEAMGYTRQSIYIANIVKCHPMKDPSNPELTNNDRPPTQEEMETCKPYLDKQIELITPKVIITLGSSSTRCLLNTEETISNLRGKFKIYNGIKLMPTFHPAAMLRNPNLKKDTWQDMKEVLAYLKQR
jgi:DNA polymerase